MPLLDIDLVLSCKIAGQFVPESLAGTQSGGQPIAIRPLRLAHESVGRDSGRSLLRFRFLGLHVLNCTRSYFFLTISTSIRILTLSPITASPDLSKLL
jgi:hypothetical protein